MRWVSWLVVLGALGWLLYAQLGPHFAGTQLPGISPESVSGTFSRAGDPPRATLRYDQLFTMLEATEAVRELDRIDATAIVKSRRPGVEPEDIALFLDDGEKVHEFTVGQYGEVDLPLRPEWRDRQLLVRSNQPPESMDLQVTFIMRSLPGPEVEYAWLWESVEQMDRALEVMGRVNGGAPREVVGVLFEYKPGQKGELRAGGAGDAAILETDANGVIRLQMTQALLDENPTLAFSPMPQRMLPLLAPVRAPMAKADGK